MRICGSSTRAHTNEKDVDVATGATVEAEQADGRDTGNSDRPLLDHLDLNHRDSDRDSSMYCDSKDRVSCSFIHPFR